MRWIKSKLRDWVREADRDSMAAEKSQSVVAVAETRRVDSIPVLNFRIFSAQNGLVLEYSSYDQKADRRSDSTYIINHDEDVADFVRQTLPMEMLKVQK